VISKENGLSDGSLTVSFFPLVLVLILRRDRFCESQMDFSEAAGWQRSEASSVSSSAGNSWDRAVLPHVSADHSGAMRGRRCSDGRRLGKGLPTRPRTSPGKEAKLWRGVCGAAKRIGASRHWRLLVCLPAILLTFLGFEERLVELPSESAQLGRRVEEGGAGYGRLSSFAERAGSAQKPRRRPATPALFAAAQSYFGGIFDVLQGKSNGISQYYTPEMSLGDAAFEKLLNEKHMLAVLFFSPVCAYSRYFLFGRLVEGKCCP